MKKNHHLLKNDLNQLRLTLLKSQIKNCYDNIPYYHKIFRENSLNHCHFFSLCDLQKYPILTKENLKKDFKQFINSKIKIENCFKSHTSGSTGEPTWTYYDRNYWVRKKYLSKLRARKACGMKIGDRIAIFEADSHEKLKKKNKSLFFYNPIFKVHFFSIFDQFEKIITKIIEFNPENIYGPPSYFFRLAQMTRKMNIHLFKLKRIFTSSEYLQKTVKKFLIDTFEADVFDIYGSTEFKEVAWECKTHEGYHINEDEVIVEVLKHSEPVRYGEIGEIVITDLRNRVMPLIRFNIKDKGVILKEKCSCGSSFTLMRPYAGRSSEYIVLPDGEYLSPYIFTTSIERVAGLLQYQIIQTNSEELIAKIIMEPKKTTSGVQEIRKILEHLTKKLMNVKVNICQKIPIEDSGKYKVIKNLLTKDYNVE